MFTIEEYFKVKGELLQAQSELSRTKSAFKYAIQIMNERQKETTKTFIELFNLSEETKTEIYDSRTTEARKTEAEPNTETIG